MPDVCRHRGRASPNWRPRVVRRAWTSRDTGRWPPHVRFLSARSIRVRPTSELTGRGIKFTRPSVSSFDSTELLRTRNWELVTENSYSICTNPLALLDVGAGHCGARHASSTDT